MHFKTTKTKKHHSNLKLRLRSDNLGLSFGSRISVGGVNKGSHESPFEDLVDNCRLIVPHRDTRFSDGNLKTLVLIGTLVQHVHLGLRLYRY